MQKYVYLTLFVATCIRSRDILMPLIGLANKRNTVFWIWNTVYAATLMEVCGIWLIRRWRTICWKLKSQIDPIWIVEKLKSQIDPIWSFDNGLNCFKLSFGDDHPISVVIDLSISDLSMNIIDEYWWIYLDSNSAETIIITQ